MEVCGVELPTRLVGRVRGKTTHTQKKRGSEEWRRRERAEEEKEGK